MGMEDLRCTESRSRCSGASAGKLVLTCLAFLFLLVACAGNKGVVKPDYSEVLGRWTRSGSIYEGFESRLYMSATYKAPAFREAYIDRYVEDYELGPAYRDLLLGRETEQSGKYNEFFFAAYTPVDKWNDFDRKDSVWRLYFEDSSGAKLSPISITKLDSSDPVIREFFPYFDLWSSAYIVKFPKYSETGTEPIPSEETGYIKLIATGVLGKGELEWRLK
ncbi:MAG: hypothetical protein ACE5GY_07705 [Thermodesulfobacteriota bacterium]